MPELRHWLRSVTVHYAESGSERPSRRLCERPVPQRLCEPGLQGQLAVGPRAALEDRARIVVAERVVRIDGGRASRSRSPRNGRSRSEASVAARAYTGSREPEAWSTFTC